MKKAFLLTLMSILICLCFTACDGKVLQSDIYISEVMSNNISTLSDENGDMCDWIELHNPTAQAINLAGYMITDASDNIDKFIFPEITLKPGEFFVVYANGVEKIDLENRVIHVPFSLSTKGESVFLYNAKGKLNGRINIVPLDPDTSYGIDENENLTVFTTPTPGKVNVEGQQTVVKQEVDLTSKIYINEYSTNSTQTLMDDEGEFVSWVEIYNASERNVNLKGYSLSDDILDPQKWVFPNFKLEAGGYALVYLSGKTKQYTEGAKRIHATFKLKGSEESLILFNSGGDEVDRCQVFDLFSNLTCGRDRKDPTKFVFFAKSTPGRANSTSGFDSVDSALYTSNREIAITEVAAVNTTVPQSAKGEYFDYVELYNNTKVELNLSNYKLSDSKKLESFKQLPDKILKPGEYIAIYCGEGDYVSKTTGNVYRNYGLNRYGETVYLMNKFNEVIDSFEYGVLKSGYCAGRDVKGSAEVIYYSALTPGKANPAATLSHSLAAPLVSRTSSYVKKGTKIVLVCDNGQIRYTTDGSTPTQKSALYTAPIVIDKTTVIRAKCFKNGFVPSDVTTATYLVTDRKHDLPVVFLTTDNDNLYGYTNGIWADGPGKSSEFPYVGANFWQEWERPVNFEYMTPNGVSQLSFDAGIKVFGQFSRANDQKSVSINLRDKYGPTEICYPFFKDNEVNVFSSFVLRNSGQDYSKSHIRDAFCAMVVKNQIDMDIMDYQPVVCYVNGKYHGIYDLREKIDEDYLANHHGIDSSNVDLIKGNNIVKSGSMDNYRALLDYIKTHDMTVQANYDYICTQIDIDELICYWMCESFFTNTDTGNIKFWRENTKTGKWRWIFFDVDWALYPSTYTYNYIENYLNPNGHGVGDSFNTTIMCGLIRNKQFRTRLLELHSKHLKTTFDTDRMLKIYDTLIAEIENEIPYHLERWGIGSKEKWTKDVEALRKIITEKKEIFIQDMIESFNMSQQEIQMYLK